MKKEIGKGILYTGLFFSIFLIHYHLILSGSVSGSIPYYPCGSIDHLDCAQWNLSLGRAYRKEFRTGLSWDEIRYNYHPIDQPAEQMYENYYQLVWTIDKFYSLMDNPNHPYYKYDERTQRGLAESVNEILTGQTMIANKILIDALRIRYPRAEDITAPRLPEPPAAREETGRLELAVLEFRLALRPAFRILREYSDAFRSHDYDYEAGFPQYTYITDTYNWPPEKPDDPPPKQPIKNEFAQLTNALARKSLASVEIGKRLFRISSRDDDALDDAISELKRGSQEAYLGSVILAACQDPDDFAMNGGERLTIHTRNAQSLFKAIKSGLTPLGDDGKFIPNESVQSLYNDTKNRVADAREAEIHARNEDRTYDHVLADLRNELLTQRQYYLTQLKNKTGVNPGEFGNLDSLPQRREYISEITNRVNSMLAEYPNVSDASALGELGMQIINIEDAKICVEAAYKELQDAYRRIEIEQDRVDEIQKVRFDPNTQEELDALQLESGYVQSHREVETTSFGNTLRAGVSTQAAEPFKGVLAEDVFHFSLEKNVIYDETSMILSQISNKERKIYLDQQARFDDINSEATIRGIYLETDNKALEIERAQNRLNQEKVKLSLMINEINSLIDDLWYTRSMAEDLYFYDPAYQVAVSKAHRRAAAELDFAIDRVYRLAKALEYYWVEPYMNPVIVPVQCTEPPALENELFDDFTEIEDVFGVRTADECKDFLDALVAWDKKLRRFSATEVRGPNQSDPQPNKDISLRQDILGFKISDGKLTYDESIRLFRDFIAAHRKENPFNPDNPGLEFTFPFTIADNRFFPAEAGRWNMRIHSMRVDIYGSSGINPSWGVALVDLIQGGTTNFRSYWGNPPYNDHLVTYNIQLGERPDWSIFKCSIPSSINGRTEGYDPASFWASGQLGGRSVAATNWLFKINTGFNENKDMDFSKLKDIIFKFKYTYGNPPEFFFNP